METVGIKVGGRGDYFMMLKDLLSILCECGRTGGMTLVV